MKKRWPIPSVLSLTFSTISLVGVVVLALVSCTTMQPQSPDSNTATQPQGSLDSLRALQSSFHAISESVSPSVVRIDVREQVSGSGPQPGLPFFDFFFGRPDDSEPEDRRFERGGVGSGVIVSADRQNYYVLTNDHVVGEADFITVILDDGTEFEAELVGRDARKDLAMVVFRSGQRIPVATLGDSDALRVGDWVAAIGSPFAYQNTLTVGIVSALDRRGGPENNISDFIQTDAAINQGNSGGALVNLDGEVVGINTWITSDSGGSIGLGFAIPINNVLRSIQEFLDDGEVSYGWLGVSIGSIDTEHSRALGVPNRRGALVNSVFAESPAAESGVMPGDFIVTIGKEPIDDSDELVLVVGEIPVNETLDVELIRNGEFLELTVQLGARRTNAAIRQSYRQLWPGFAVYPLTDRIVEQAGIETQSGVMVSTVDSGTAADIGGLQPFDVITAINGAEVSDLLSFYDLVGDPDLREWNITGIRDNEDFEITVVR